MGSPWRVRVATLLTALVVAIGAAVQASSSSQAGDDVTPKARADLEAAQQFDGFRLYYVGDSYEGLPLSDILRSRNFGRTNWSFIYGDCEPPPDDPEPSCALPLQIGNHSICVRFPGRYPGKPKLFNFRGAKALRNHLAGSFEIYTGRTAIAIFTDGTVNKEDVGYTVHALRGGRPGERLRPPAEGALRGGLPCQRKWRS